MKRIPLLLCLIAFILFGCEQENTLTAVTEKQDDRPALQSDQIKQGDDLKVDLLVFREKAVEAEDQTGEPADEGKVPPAYSDEVKAASEALLAEANKSGWFSYQPDWYDPYQCNCYYNSYWPGPIADIHVTSDNPWSVYGYDWLTLLGYGRNVLRLNGVAVNFQMYGFFSGGSIRGYDANGAFVSAVSIPNVWPGFVSASFSRPVKYVEIHSVGWDFLDFFHVQYVEENRAPVANAGPDQSVVAGSGATLDGSASSDPDGNTLSYVWKDAGNQVVGTSAGVNLPAFAAVGANTYTLTVSDGQLSSSDQVTVTVTNTAPVADAGSDQTIYAGVATTLDASGSSDADGHALTYEWSNGESTTAITVGPLNSGSYTFTVTVSDGFGGSDSDEVTVEVVPIPVTFDVKPNDANNTVQAKSKGGIPTAILSSSTFDATQVDVSSLAFGPGGAKEIHGKGHAEDANGDGLVDLVLHFSTTDAKLSGNDTSACVTGKNADGWDIKGCDSVNVK